jgi:hypothetical protein
LAISGDVIYLASFVGCHQWIANSTITFKVWSFIDIASASTRRHL